MDTSTILGFGLAALLVAAVAGVVTLRNRRLGVLKGRAKFIQQYAFPAELRNRLQREAGFTLEQSGRVLDGLRQYFLACLSAQRGAISKEVGMPSKAVDAAWHEFIVLTREYAKFCDAAFGRYLHHTPRAMMAEPTSAAVANTLHQFRQPALTPAGWATLAGIPLLFALDRELGLKDGHHYDESALAALEQQRLALVSGSGGGGDSGGSSSSDSGWSPGADSSGGDGGGGAGSCGGGGGCGGS